MLTYIATATFSAVVGAALARVLTFKGETKFGYGHLTR